MAVRSELPVPVAAAETGDRVAIDVGAGEPVEGAAVWLLPVARVRTVPIGRGENRGRTATYANVVRGFTRVGTWTGEPARFEVPIAAAREGEADAYVVLLQDVRHGEPGGHPRGGEEPGLLGSTPFRGRRARSAPRVRPFRPGGALPCVHGGAPRRSLECGDPLGGTRMSVLARWRRLAVVALVLSPAPFASAQAPTTLPPAPEAPTGRVSRQAGHATRDMVAAANPLAAEAGRQILAAGGSAVDAAIAVQLVLNLVEPQSSGIGGGAFLLHYDHDAAPDDGARRPRDGARRGEARALPRAGRQAPEVLRRGGRRPLGRRARHGAAPGGRPQALRPPALGAPVRAGDRARRGGFRDLAAPQRPPLAGAVPRPRRRGQGVFLRGRRDGEGGRDEAARIPPSPQTLRTLAEKGAAAFYSGPLAEDIVATVTGHAGNPGDMTLDDLKGYAVVERAARLRQVPRLHDLRHGPAEFRRRRRAADSRRARDPRPRPHGAGGGGGALDGGGRPPRLRRPGALSRRPRLRERAGARPHRPGLQPRPGAASQPGPLPRPRQGRRAALRAPRRARALGRHRERDEPHLGDRPRRRRGRR